MTERNFEDSLLEAVDEALSSLGSSSKQAIYFHLEKSFHIKRYDIPHRIGPFTQAIEKIFGLGANFLEVLIMKRLYEKIGGVFDWGESDFTFTRYIAIAKRTFMERNRIEAEEGLIKWEELQVET